MEPENERDDDPSHPGVTGEHPLLNSVIMENLFKHMESSVTFQDLKSVRAVCSLWNELTLTKWRSMATLRLGPPTSEKGTPHNSKSLPVNKFIAMSLNLESPYQFGRKPFTKYALHSINFVKIPRSLKTSGASNPNGNLWALFDSLGIQLDTFKFEDCIFPGNRFQVFEEIFSKKLKNVEKLSLTRTRIPAKCPEEEIIQMRAVDEPEFTPGNLNLKALETDGLVPMDTLVLLINCANLESWKIQNNSNRDGNFHMILMQLKCHRDRLQLGPSKIKTLDTMNSEFFSDGSLWLPVNFQLFLQHLQMRLESLSLNLEPYSSDINLQHLPKTDVEHILIPFIREYQQSLKVLKVFRSPVYKMLNLKPFTGVDLSALTELHLLGNVVNSFSFLASTPNLKILSVDLACVDKVGQFERLHFHGKESRRVKLEKFQERYQPYDRDLLEKTPVRTRELISLEQMYYLRLDCPISKKTVKWLAGWMPNLKIFQGNFKSEEMRAVFKWMQNLEELVVLPGSDFDEKILTGDKGHGRRHPANITALKCLRRFQMDGSCGGKCVVSEHSVKTAFLEMASLESLRICVSESLDQESEDALQKHVSGLTIIREKADHDDSERECCKRAAFMREYLGH